MLKKGLDTSDIVRDAFGPFVRAALGSPPEGSRSTATAAGSSSLTLRSAGTGMGPGISS